MTLMIQLNIDWCLQIGNIPFLALLLLQVTRYGLCKAATYGLRIQIHWLSGSSGIQIALHVLHAMTVVKLEELQL
jgi:hypothetical protein